MSDQTQTPDTQTPETQTPDTRNADTTSVLETGQSPDYATTGYETSAATVEPDTTPVNRGPAPVTVLLGLAFLAVAGLAFTSEVTDLGVDWGSVGPASVVIVGVVLVLLGLLGMRGRRR